MVINGAFTWGFTSLDNFPLNYEDFFNTDLNIIDWLRQFTSKVSEKQEEYIRGFLGKILFTGDDTLKKKLEFFQEVKKCGCILS